MMQTAMTTIRNDGKKPATITNTNNRAIKIAPGEQRTVLIPFDQAEWLKAYVAGHLTVLQREF